MRIKSRFFGFDAEAGPASGVVSLGLFKPGIPQQLNVADITVPAAVINTCPTDLDQNGTVDAVDVALLLGSWGPNTGSPADFSADDAVDAADLALLLGDWGPCVVSGGDGAS